LEELHLDRNDIGLIGPTGIEDLCSSTTLRRLRVLSLARNPIGAAGIAELAVWPGLRQLRWLDLSNCELTATVLRPLEKSQYRHDDLTIILDGNPCSPTYWTPLRELWLSESLS
jgi:hypothetical protein